MASLIPNKNLLQLIISNKLDKIITNTFCYLLTMSKKSIKGLQIIGFYPNSQLAKSGVEKGDWLKEYNGEEIKDEQHLQELKLKFQHAQKVIIKIVKKDGEEQYFEILPGDLGLYLAEIAESPEISEDAKRIENIGRLEIKTGKENTFFYSLPKLLQKFDLEIAVEKLIVFACFPFRIQFKKDISENLVDPTFGFDCSKTLFDSMNISFETFANNSSKKKIKKELINSINRGYPILARGLFGEKDWGIITGYQNNKKDFFCRSFHDNTIDYSIAPQLPNKIIVFNEDPNFTEIKENNFINQHKKCLSQARDLFFVDEINGYYQGNKSIEKWMEFLEDDEFFDEIERKEFNRMFFANDTLFTTFQHNCIIVYEYLEKLQQEELFPESKRHLRRLIKFYKAESKILEDCLKNISRSTSKNLKKSWSKRTRKKEVTALTKIYKKNREIITVIDKLPLIL